MLRLPYLAALMAFLVLLFSSLATGSPITETADDMAVLEARGRPACTGNDGCVNYGHRRCGDPFGLAKCVKG
ncbi:hypothetical protein QBC39DRAFT_371845 [Podospora conica]|nr:hypothetical protein QBC39DRAFT_371845 [Schizothecium conicum]